MSKILFAALLAASVISSSCNKTPEPANRPEEAASKSERATGKSPGPGASLVTIMLSGLMVLHKDQAKGTYEVGVIPNAHHVFKFTVDGMAQKPTGKNWTIEVTNAAPTAAMPEAKGHAGRNPDDINGQWDFDWVIDLEGPEFHNAPVVLTEGVLNPIIHLPNGRLYTKFKSILLQRRQGTGALSDFGFVPETMAIDLELQPNQELVLKDDMGHSTTLLQPNPGQHIVRIGNIPEKPMEESDFHLYYDLLFKKVPKNEQFDFDGVQNAKVRPYNPHPDLAIKTCCLMDCSLVYLGSRTQPLR